jgi:hypothetical protein
MMMTGTKGEHILSLGTNDEPTQESTVSTLKNRSAHIQASSELP